MDTLLTEKLNDLKKLIDGWTPQKGFKPSPINFDTADIIFGRWVAQSVQLHGCCKNPELVIEDIRNEAMRDSRFRSWLLSMETERLQTLCEFLIYRTPPRFAKN